MNIKSLIALGIATVSLVSPTQALAQSPTPGAIQTQKITALRTQCDNAVSQRLTALSDVSTKVNGLTKLSADQKSKFSSLIQTNINGLTALKSKCDGDTVLTTLRTDYKNVFLNFRVYAVFLPQTNILVASDTMAVTTDQLMTLLNALQIRVQQSGNPPKLNTLLSDMQSKINDAKTQYANAQSLISPLTPQSFNADPNGTKIAETNARNSIKTGASDLKTAFQDAQQIRAGLKLSSATPSATP